MRYLINDNAVNSPVSNASCTCFSGSCDKRTCNNNICVSNRDSCPKHCWVQVCVKAKVDPFSVVV